MDPHPRAFRTLRRQPGGNSNGNVFPASPIMNEMYEDVNLPQPVLQNGTAMSQQTPQMIHSSSNGNHAQVGGAISLPFMEGQQPYDNVVTNKQQLRGVSTLPGYF